MNDVKQIDADKIDMVYLWCDGNEKNFQKRKEFFLSGKNIDNVDNEACGEMRFFDNDELKYSLRSLEMYAPWINHVYIVTDRQIPKWLNIGYAKVTVVDHSEIMPQELIPCFNSAVIEYFLPFIPGLQEKFLYGNDDTFFGNYVYPEDFFLGDKPIVRVEKHKGRLDERNDYDLSRYSWKGTILNSLNLLKTAYGKNVFYVPHHNIDAYKRTLFIETLKKFQKNIEECFHNRFRQVNDLQRILFGMDMVYKGMAELKIIEDPKPWRQRFHFFKKVKWESYCNKEDREKTQKCILKFKPKLFCINSSTNCSKEIKVKNKKFMELLFPVKSKFEL